MNIRTLQRSTGVIGLGLVVLSACQTPADAAPAPVAWVQVRSSAICPVRESVPEREPPVPQVIDDALSWDRAVRGAPSDVLGLAPDWTRQRVVLITVGARPTGGWSITPVPASTEVGHPPGWVVHQGQLQAEVKIQAPALDAMVTQAFTSPCLWVLLPRAGWQSVVLRTRP